MTSSFILFSFFLLHDDASVAAGFGVLLGVFGVVLDSLFGSVDQAS